MSNDVVISKEMRDKLIEELDYHEPHSMASEIKELLAAPETVSLEGVESEIRSLMDYLTGIHVDGERFSALDVVNILRNILSDLRRLVAPVQPSAVQGPALEQYKALFGLQTSR